MSRTKKRPYRKSRRFDKTCRNHGSCSYCRSNRTHANVKRLEAAETQLKNAEYNVGAALERLVECRAEFFAAREETR